MLKLPISLAVLAADFAAAAAVGSYSASGWNLKEFKSLVTFGDSYTDNSRLFYFILHGGAAPPMGWIPTTNSTYPAADGGRPWPNYVAQYNGANVYNYAVSGAVCSNDITPRFSSIINADFPAVAQYEVPAYIADSKYKPNGGKFLQDDPSTTVYSIWIGTNDLGNNAFLTDSQVKGKNIEDYMDCVFDQIYKVYRNGGRYFVIQNVVPLNLAPLYATPEDGGVGPNQYWATKPSNLTEISYRMLEQVAEVNAIYSFRTPFATEVLRRYPGAHFAIYDMHGLFTDIYNYPSKYLNGTAPLSVQGYAHHCDLQGQACILSSSPDSFLWYDELHPSEQTERVIAKNFIDVVNGSSQWATYWN